MTIMMHVALQYNSEVYFPNTVLVAKNKPNDHQ